MFSSPVSTILVVVAVGYVVARRLLGEPAQARRMLVLPAVLGVLGLVNVLGAGQTPVSVVFLGTGIVINTAFGLARGAGSRVFDREGVACVRYTVTTIVVWACGIAAEFGTKFLFGLIDHEAEEAAGHGLMLTLGAGILAEGVVVLVKVTKSGARIDWTIRSGRRGDRTPDGKPLRANGPTARPRPRPAVSLLDELHASRRRDRSTRRRRR